jgi:hypothetical protein
MSFVITTNAVTTNIISTNVICHYKKVITTIVFSTNVDKKKRKIFK